MLMMLPFEAPTIFEGIHKSYFRMPRVVKDQRSRFENDDLFRQLSHESAVKYTGFKDRPLEERQMKFIANCQEGHTEVSVVQSGSQFTLMFNPTSNPAYNNEGCDFDKELGKVHIKAGFILNGVCVLWRGWIDLQRLEGFGCVEYDEYRAYLEEAMAKQSIDKQQTCNSLANNQTSIGRLNHHLGGAPLLPPQSFNPATAAAAVAAITTNSIIPPSPLGLNPACLGGGPVVSHPGSNLGPPQPSGQVNSALQQQLPPVSLADSAAHYGGAALAAAAAAAFHQALSIGGAGPPPPHSHQLNLPGVPPSSTLAGGSHHPLVPTQHLPYSNGSNIIQAAQRSHSPLSGGHHHNVSPQHHHFLNDTQTSNLTTTNGNPSASMQHNNQTRSPERENHHHHHPQQHHPTLNTNNSNSRRQATKRAPEEMTQTDEVDVVSDINVHELDFPPRRIFKSEGITTGHLSQKAARRAAS